MFSIFTYFRFLSFSLSLPVTSDYVETAVRHVMMKQGILGVKVSIMLPHDPKGIVGPKTLLSDVITILEPKDQRSY
jgi:small subunit ribosomal protein S3e